MRCACWATGGRLAIPVVTADQRWAQVRLAIAIKQVR